MIDPGSDRTVTGHDAVAGSRRAYAVVLLLIAVFIVYGSLFPFEYRERSYPGGPVLYLLSTWLEWDHRGDLLSNILLYLPFGFFGAGVLPSRLPALRRVLVMTIAGIVLSCCMEIAQFHDSDRVTSMGDVYANAIGTGVGGLAAVVIGASMRWPFMRELGTHPTASLLLMSFFGSRLYPYVPMIDMHKYWHAVRPMLSAPSLPLGELTSHTITWLVIAAIIHSLYGYRRSMLLFPLVCGCEFLGKVLIVDNALTLTDVVGAAAAFLIWVVLLRRMPMRFAVVALALAGLIVVQRLLPFQFGAAAQGFGWVPFASLMRGAVGPAVQELSANFYEFGGLIWLLSRAGAGLPIGTFVTAVLLLAVNYIECWLPGRPAEITDAVLAVAIGSTFALLRHAARGRGAVSGTVRAERVSGHPVRMS